MFRLCICVYSHYSGPVPTERSSSHLSISSEQSRRGPSPVQQLSIRGNKETFLLKRCFWRWVIVVTIFMRSFDKVFSRKSKTNVSEFLEMFPIAHVFNHTIVHYRLPKGYLPLKVKILFISIIYLIIISFLIFFIG